MFFVYRFAASWYDQRSRPAGYLDTSKPPPIAPARSAEPVQSLSFESGPRRDPNTVDSSSFVDLTNESESFIESVHSSAFVDLTGESGAPARRAKKSVNAQLWSECNNCNSSLFFWSFFSSFWFKFFLNSTQRCVCNKRLLEYIVE